MKSVKNYYNLARGTLRLEAVGMSPETLLNDLSYGNIKFFDAEKKDDFTLCFTVFAADITETRRLADKNNCDLKILRTRGGRELSSSVKRRFALLAGLIAAVLLISVSSLFIWQIDVTGNESISYGEILRELEDCGVGYGTFWPTVSTENVKNEILLKNKDIAWLSLNMGSSRLEVNIHERVNKPDIIKEAEPRSIYAAKAGIITNVSVLQGKSVVSVGDTVCEGELLVSELMDSETGDDRTVHAVADVTARTWYEISAVLPLETEKKVDSKGTDLKLSLICGKNNIIFYGDSRNKKASCDKINKLRLLSISDFFVLPVGISVQRAKACITESVLQNAEAEALRLEDDLLSELRYRIGDGEIVSSSFAVSKKDGLLIVTLRAECLENIA